MNIHDPPTEAEVRAALWQRLQRLQDRLDERTEQRDELLTTCQTLIDSAWICGRERTPIIERAQHTLKVIREYKETE